jgi:HSF-type DNA-binding
MGLAYHDYSNVSNAWIEQRQRELLPTKGRGNSGAKKMFPIQLYRMLKAVDGTQHSLLIRWLPHGRAFVVLEANRFAAEVLPTYFPSQTKFTSFQRQLNIYGFLRCVRVDDGYYHELFLRGRPVLATLIPRLSQGPYGCCCCNIECCCKPGAPLLVPFGMVGIRPECDGLDCRHSMQQRSAFGRGGFGCYSLSKVRILDSPKGNHESLLASRDDSKKAKDPERAE